METATAATSARGRRPAAGPSPAGPAAGVGRTSEFAHAALPTWSPASKRGMAGRSAESGGLRARWWPRRWRNLVLGRWWLLRRIRVRSMRLRAILRSSAMLPVAEFPAWEAEPGERVVHDEIYGERLRVLKALAGARSDGARSEEFASPHSLRDPRSSLLASSSPAFRACCSRCRGGMRWRRRRGRFALAGGSMSRS